MVKAIRITVWFRVSLTDHFNRSVSLDVTRDPSNVAVWMNTRDTYYVEWIPHLCDPFKLPLIHAWLYFSNSLVACESGGKSGRIGIGRRIDLLGRALFFHQTPQKSKAQWKWEFILHQTLESNAIALTGKNRKSLGKATGIDEAGTRISVLPAADLRTSVWMFVSTNLMACSSSLHSIKTFNRLCSSNPST